MTRNSTRRTKRNDKGLIRSRQKEFSEVKVGVYNISYVGYEKRKQKQ